MGQMEAPPQRSRLRFKGTIEQRIAHTAMEASCAVMRGEEYSEHLVGRAHELFSADAGVGLTTWCPSRLDATDQLAVAVAGIPPLSIEQTLLASSFASTHPGFLAMARAGTAGAIRVSDHTDLVRFWTTESYWRMHGHCDGRYPASALLLDTRETQIFLGIHRRDRDFSDADLAWLATLQRTLAAAMLFRAALDDTIQLLQRSSSEEEASAPAGRAKARRRTLDAAARLCCEYTPTRREGEVLALTAQGWTNQQIGRRLGITERTVRKHLTAVYDKAGVRGRAAAAAWWQRLSD